MPGQYILALDAGTTSVRSVLFRRDGTIAAMNQKEFRQIYPQAGWVEHDAAEIWEAQLETAKTALEQAGAAAPDICAVGITNQRETAVVWDRETGRPVGNAIVWQCRRTADFCAKLKSDGLAPMIRERTGLVPDPYFSASKLRWILKNTPGAEERAKAGKLLFGTVDSWLIWNLTGGKIHRTDYTNAARTMLFNIHTLRWDPELTALFEVPEKMLPEVTESSALFGMADPALFGAEIPIGGVAGDQHAALFGQCCFSPGDAKNTYGTGCFLLMNTGTEPSQSRHGMLTTIAWGEGGRVNYALEGSVFVAGAAIQWLRDELRIIDSAAESEQIAASVPDAGGVYVVPAFTGLGAPHWDAYARGTVTGLTRGSGRRELVRATLEAVAYQSEDLLRAMQADSGLALQGLRVDGGASRNNFLMQFQADISRVPVLRPDCVETTAQGAAFLAGLAVGFWSGKDEIAAINKTERVFTPDMQEGKRAALLAGWQDAIRRTRTE